MALQFIFGNSISEKSEFIYQSVVEKAQKHLNIRYLFVVPEQASLLVQKEVVKAHPMHALGNIDILSFNRLAYRIFEEQNIPILHILDDTGKAMILRKVAQEQKGSLTAFQKNLSRAGFIDELKSIVSEFYQYGIQKEQLEHLVSHSEKHPLLQLKLKDLLTVYTSFHDKLKNEYITAEELLPMLCKVVESKRSAYISESVIILDGFTGFTPVQYKLLELLMIHARQLICSVTIGSGVDPYQKPASHELFFMSRVIVENMREMAIRCGISYGKDRTVPPEWSKEWKEEFRHLEKQLFCYPMHPYKKEPESVLLYSARSPKEEVSFLVREILRLVRENGWEYRDIAVVTGDLEAYQTAMIHQFTRAGIPFFIDQKKNLSGNPLTKLVRSALEVMQKGFSYETVFYYLKNRLITIEQQELDELENYVIALGIRGKKKWQQEWERTYRGFAKQKLAKINQTREKVMQPFHILLEAEDKKELTVRERTEALFFFLRELQAEEKLSAFAKQFGEMEEFNLQKEYEQAYDKFLDLLDQLVELMGDEVFSLDAYAEILEAGMDNIQVGLIPATIDRLVAGDVMRTRLGKIKALYVLGLNDGILPKSGERGGLLSDLDREWIRSLNVELAPTAKEDAFTQKYYVYLMLTKASEKLVLSYSRINEGGKSIRPSYLIDSVKKIFPYLKEQTVEQNTEGLLGMTLPKDSFELLIQGIRSFLNGEETVWWRELYSWYFKQPEYQKRLDMIREGLFYSYKKEELTKQTAARLFAQTPMNSVTRLEKFASCAYAHFLAYGLGITQRVEHQISAVDYGNIFHKSIETFFHETKEKNLDWTNLTMEKRMELVSKSVQATAKEYGNTIFQSSARNRYLVQRMERITDRTVWALSEQWKDGAFEKSETESDFSAKDDLPGMKLPLRQGMELALQGRIDRVDISEKEDSVYVKVIDYKSGSTDFDFTRIYHGLQLQLIIYLEAALQIEQKKYPDKKVVPAGIYYYHIKDPIVEQENPENEAAAEKAVKQELKMNGLSNSNPEILDLLDRSGNKKSEIIKNLERDDSGMAIRSSVAADSKQMEKLCKFGLNKAQTLGKQMLDGKIEVSPYEYKKKSPCDYCEFLSVCGFDTKIDGFGYRRLRTMKPDEMWDVLEKTEHPGDAEDIGKTEHPGDAEGIEKSEHPGNAEDIGKLEHIESGEKEYKIGQKFSDQPDKKGEKETYNGADNLTENKTENRIKNKAKNKTERKEDV